MMRDAESHAEEDKKKRDLIEAKNQAEAQVYSLEKSLREYGDKIGASERQEIESAIEKCRKVKDGNDAQAIKSAVEEMLQKSHKIAEHIYGAQQAGAGAPPGGCRGGSCGGNGNGNGNNNGAKRHEEDVYEAEFEEKTA